jgi:hypothetical protein
MRDESEEIRGESWLWRGTSNWLTSNSLLLAWRRVFDSAPQTVVAVSYGGETDSTEMIAAERHTGVHASAIACKTNKCQHTAGIRCLIH